VYITAASQEVMGGCTSQPAAEQPTLPVLTEATPEERAIASVKVIFDSIAKDGEGSVSKMELINKLGPHETVRGLIKESSLNQNWGAMKDTRIEGRVTWEEFYANLTSHMPKKQEIVTATAEVAADEKALEHLKKLFHTLDANGDKAVSKEELAAALAKDESIENLVKEAGFNPQYCTFTNLDDKGEGRITWEEFEAHLRSAAKEEAKVEIELAADERALEHLRRLYQSLDSNEDKAVSRLELAAGLRKDEAVADLVKEAGFNPQYSIFEQVDGNEDGRITWEEFEAHLRIAAVEQGKEELVAGTLEVAPVMEVPQAGGEAPQPKGFWCGC